MARRHCNSTDLYPSHAPSNPLLPTLTRHTYAHLPFVPGVRTIGYGDFFCERERDGEAFVVWVLGGRGAVGYALFRFYGLCVVSCVV